MSVFHHLTTAELDRVKQLAEPVACATNARIINEGDEADCIYFVAEGYVKVYINRFASTQELSWIGPGQYFGEMGVLNNQKRSASIVAATDCRLLRVTKADFLRMLRESPEFSQRLHRLLAERTEEQVLKQKLLSTTGICAENLHIGIKGDPSMRESAFTRERHDSVVDATMPELLPRIEELLLVRSGYEVFIHFNSGEIRIVTLFDPFHEEIHTADKLLDEAYLDTHFPVIHYEQKADIVRATYAAIAATPGFAAASSRHRHLYETIYARWQPVPPDEIRAVLRHLPALRRIPNFYLRNIAIGMGHNAIRMQFNCDGTHVVSTKSYTRFVEQNIALD